MISSAKQIQLIGKRKFVFKTNQWHSSRSRL